MESGKVHFFNTDKIDSLIIIKFLLADFACAIDRKISISNDLKPLIV
ncbi:hypothetical protein [Paenibacillus sp. FSL K6-2524]